MSAGGSSARAVRQAQKAGTFDPRLAALLTSRNPGFFDTKAERAWKMDAGRYGLFLERNSQAPRAGVGGQEGHLGTWLAGVRVAYRDGGLEDWQVKLLERIPGHAWEDDRWATKHAAAAAAFAAGDLGEHRAWVKRQARRFSTGKMSADQQYALDTTIPGWRHLG